MNHKIFEFFIDTTNVEATEYIYKVIDECKEAGLPIYLIKEHQEDNTTYFYLKGDMKTYEMFVPNHTGSGTPDKFCYSLEHFLE
jgi:hypothetical protein